MDARQDHEAVGDFSDAQKLDVVYLNEVLLKHSNGVWVAFQFHISSRRPR